MRTATISHFDEGILLHESNNCATYQLKLTDGDGTAVVCLIYPGIEVAKVTISSHQYWPNIKKSKRILEINYCLSGRFECRMKDGCLQYVGEGDLFLTSLQNHSDIMELPLGYYQGFIITVDLDQVSDRWGNILSGLPDNICGTLERFFLNDDCFMIQSKEYIKHIFTGMESSPAEAAEVFYRLKVMDLLLFLYYFNPAGEKQKHTYVSQQVDIIKQIQKQITEQFSSRFTIEELAREYCISTTAIKTHFKAVYGQSIATYMKNYRIRKAAIMLSETEQSIAIISKSAGYESQSKFTAAFKDIMKTTPLEYRKAHRNKDKL